MSRRRAQLLGLVTVLVLLAASCSSGDDGDTSATTAPPDVVIEPTGELSPLTCDVQRPHSECFTLTVSSTHGDEDADTFALPVMVVHPQGGVRHDDPIVRPDGGPGFSDMFILPESYDTGREVADATGRDVIYWAQRGTPEADPFLNCPEIEAAVIDNLERAAPWEDEVERHRDATSACRDRLVDEGHDLSLFNTEQSAYDGIALRRALGAEQWNVFGISYGTRLGIEMARRDPDAIRSLVLDSLYAPGSGSIAALSDELARGQDLLFESCAADPDCSARTPDLEATLDEAIERFDQEPDVVPVTLTDGSSIDLTVTGTDVAAAVISLLRESTALPQLPATIADFAAGDTSSIPAIAPTLISFLNDQAEGMTGAVECADNAVSEDPDAASVLDGTHPFRAYLFYAALTHCDVWDVPAAVPPTAERLESDTPALLLTGGRDSLTDPAEVHAFAEGLTDVTEVVVDEVSHAVVLSSECGHDLLVAFITDPEATLDTSCAD